MQQTKPTQNNDNGTAEEDESQQQDSREETSAGAEAAETERQGRSRATTSHPWVGNREEAGEPPPQTKPTETTERIKGECQRNITLQCLNINMEMHTTRQTIRIKGITRRSGTCSNPHKREQTTEAPTRTTFPREKYPPKYRRSRNTNPTTIWEWGKRNIGKSNTEPTRARTDASNTKTPRTTSEQDMTKATDQQKDHKEAARD